MLAQREFCIILWNKNTLEKQLKIGLYSFSFVPALVFTEIIALFLYKSPSKATDLYIDHLVRSKATDLYIDRD